MAVQDSNGNWIASGGGGAYSDKYQADAAERERKARESGGGGGGGSSGGGIFYFILFTIPLLLAKGIGFLIGLLLKIGIVGRVILTVLFTVMAWFMFLLLADTVRDFIPANLPSIVRTIMDDYLAPAAALYFGIAWFWRKHYPVLKSMPVSDFAELFKYCLAWAIYGSIGFSIVLFFLSKIFHWKDLPFGLPIVLASTVAIVTWIVKANEYDPNAYADADEEMSIDEIISAAESGDADAQYKLSWAYCEGSGVAKDEAKEYEWCRKAAENGHAEAQYYTGLAFAEGRGGYTIDKNKAREWLNKSAAQGYAEANTALNNL